MWNFRRVALLLIAMPLILTIAAILNPFPLYSYDGRTCSKVDFYFGTFKLGSLELGVREVQNSSSPVLSRSHNTSIVYLPEKVPFIGVRCQVNKTLEVPPPGAPEDTVGVGLIVRLPDDSECILLCSAAQSNHVIHHTSVKLGDVYECTSTRVWSDISTAKVGNVSVLFLDYDFLPAFMLMAKHKVFSPLDVDVVGVYIISDTIVSNEGGRFLGITTSGLLGWIGLSPSNIFINESAIPLQYGVARVDAFKGLYAVGIEFSAPFLPFSKKIEFSIEL
ncbi:MAG: hypothetical protein ACUVQ5_04435 [Candidatus Methanomethylicaceae archaeon]